MKQKMKFNIPKDEIDKRKLLIDLEENVGVILKETDTFFIVAPYGLQRELLELMIEMLNLIYLHVHFLGEKDYYELVDKMQKLYKKALLNS